ncbi:hypothetical protein NODU109028_18545 [Nocardioides dubius]
MGVGVGVGSLLSLGCSGFGSGGVEVGSTGAGALVGSLLGAVVVAGASTTG